MNANGQGFQHHPPTTRTPLRCTLGVHHYHNTTSHSSLRELQPLCTCCTVSVDPRLHPRCFSPADGSAACSVRSAFQMRSPRTDPPASGTVGGQSLSVGWQCVGEYGPPLCGVLLVREFPSLFSTICAKLLPGLSRLSGRNADWPPSRRWTR